MMSSFFLGSTSEASSQLGFSHLQTEAQQALLESIRTTFVSYKSSSPDYASLFKSAYEAIREGCEYLEENDVDMPEEIHDEAFSPTSAVVPSGDVPLLAKITTLIPLIIGLIQIILSLIPDPQLTEIINQNEIVIEQQSEEIALLQNLVNVEEELLDMQQQLLDRLNSSGGLSTELEDSVVETDNLALESGDCIDNPADLPESESEGDAYEQDAKTDPD